MENKYNSIVEAYAVFSKYQRSVFEPIEKSIKDKYKEGKRVFLILAIVSPFLPILNSKWNLADQHFMNFFYAFSVLCLLLLIYIFIVQQNEIKKLIEKQKGTHEYLDQKQLLKYVFNNLGIDFLYPKTVMNIFDEIKDREDLNFVNSNYVDIINEMGFEIEYNSWSGGDFNPSVMYYYVYKYGDEIKSVNLLIDGTVQVH